MTHRSAILLLLVLAAAMLILVINSRRLTAAENELDAARKSLNAAMTDAREILQLRAQRQRIAHAEHPTQDVIARINSVIAEAGLPSRCFKSLTPSSNTVINNAGGSASDGTIKYRRQSLRLSLEDLEPPELGRFLTRWRSTQPLWTITSIELAHQRSRNRTDGRYDITIILTALYVADN